MTCYARQFSDHMVCAKCDLAWDVNDCDPPSCKRCAATDECAKTVERLRARHRRTGEEPVKLAPHHWAALDRAISHFEAEANHLMAQRDYGAMFPESDAQALREVSAELGRLVERDALQDPQE